MPPQRHYKVTVKRKKTQTVVRYKISIHMSMDLSTGTLSEKITDIHAENLVAKDFPVSEGWRLVQIAPFFPQPEG